MKSQLPGSAKMEFILLIGLIVLVFFVIGMVRRKNTLADLQIEASKAPPASRPSQPTSQQIPPADRVQLLERLQKLKESGTLTDDEFAAEKARILSSTSSPAASSSSTNPPEAPTLIDQLARHGYQIKPTGQNTWRITEPLGGRTNIAGVDDLADYVNGVMARVGR